MAPPAPLVPPPMHVNHFVPVNLALWLDCVHGYLTVGQANLTVKMGCSHYKLTWEVERSGTCPSISL